MRKILLMSAVTLFAGSVYASPWDDYSEAGSTAFHRDYSAQYAIAGQPGAGDTPNASAGNLRQVTAGDTLSWDNYSESGSTAFHRNYAAEKSTATAGQPGFGVTMGRGERESDKIAHQDILSWANYSENGSSAFHRDFLYE